MTSINKSQAEIKDLLEYITKNSSDGGVTFSKSDYERLFEDIEYYNNSDWDDANNNNNKNIEGLSNKIKDLEDKISKLQAEAEEIQQDIEEISEVNTKHMKEIAELTATFLDAEEENNEAIEEASERAAIDASKAFHDGGETGDIDALYKQYFTEYCPLQYKYKMQSLQATIGAKQYNMTNELEKVYQCQQKLGNLKSKLDVTTGTIKMLERTKSNMASTMEGAYENVDTDDKAAIFTGSKADFANSLLAQYQSRYSKEGSGELTADKSEEQKTLMDSYSSQNTNKFVSGDKYNRATNPELENFNKLVDDGMLTKLSEAGLSKNDILEFISDPETGWNIGVKKNEDGTWFIPYGHGTTGHRETTKGYEKDADGTAAIYNKLNDFIQKDTEVTAASANQAQVKELVGAMEGDNDILTQMYKKGFTFKEAMQTLTAIFPDAGITYDISKQKTGDNPNPNAPSNDTRNYEIVTDSSETKGTYDKIADEILKYWNVGATNPKSEEENDDDPSTERSDPMTFNKDGYTYTFIEDRPDANGVQNGKFDYADGFNNDLLGSKDGMNELFAYDYNKDGKIDENDKVIGDDGKVVQMTNVDGTTRDRTALDMLQVMINKQTESVSNASDVDDYKDGDSANDKSDKWTNQVDFGLGYTSAQNLGITEIDLSGFVKGNNADGTVIYDADLKGAGDERYNTDKQYDGIQEKFEDINGSAVINQFTIKTSKDSVFKGEDQTINETLNTLDNLDTFYSQIAKEQGTSTNSDKIVIGFNKQTAQDALNSTKWEGFTSSGDKIEGTDMTLEQLAKSLNDQIEDMDTELKRKETVIKSGEQVNEVVDDILGKDLTQAEKQARIKTHVNWEYSPEEPGCNEPDDPEPNPAQTDNPTPAVEPEPEPEPQAQVEPEPEPEPAPQTTPEIEVYDEILENFDENPNPHRQH